jgi:hypothetical protein
MLNQRDDLGVWRSMPVKKLREILAALPDDAHVYVNRVGNLNVAEGDPSDVESWEDIGYVDITDERYVPRSAP